jgi:CRP/FNR family transcriptional regulator, cyclic AMP receptor protein
MSDNIFDVSEISLSRLEVFSELGMNERNEAAKLFRGNHFGINQQIVSHLDSSDEVFFIINGVVRITIYSITGKETTFRDMTAGQMFGELSAIDGMPRSAHAIALTSCTILFISANSFWELLEKYPSVSKKTLKHLTKLIRLLSDRVVEFSTLAVKSRIHAEMLRLARNGNQVDGFVSISPPPTHSSFASRLGTHREAVTRELGALTRRGIIIKKSNSHIVLDIEKLKKLVADAVNDV